MEISAHARSWEITRFWTEEVNLLTLVAQAANEKLSRVFFVGRYFRFLCCGDVGTGNVVSSWGFSRTRGICDWGIRTLTFFAFWDHGAKLKDVIRIINGEWGEELRRPPVDQGQLWLYLIIGNLIQHHWPVSLSQPSRLKKYLIICKMKGLIMKYVESGSCGTVS